MGEVDGSYARFAASKACGEKGSKTLEESYPYRCPDIMDGACGFQQSTSASCCSGNSSHVPQRPVDRIRCLDAEFHGSAEQKEECSATTNSH